MGVNWAAGLMRWKPHAGANGRTYSLAHLHPFRFELEFEAHGQYAARTVAIRVGFGLHVFTCDLADAGPNPEHYGDSRETRAFDEQRYNASFQLEALVRGLESRKCFFAKNQNFFTVELAGAPASHEYRVFFSVRCHAEAADTIELIVQSAYFGRAEQRPKGQRGKPIGFRVIISNTLLGKPLREPR